MNKNPSLNLSRIPEELKLILDIIKAGKEINPQLNNQWITKTIDWNLFLQLAIHHRVHPLLYSYFKKVDTYNLIPSFVIQELSQMFKINTFQMLQLRAEMDEVGDLLSRNVIPLLFLKGPVLATELYGDLSLRTSCDLDLLVPIEDLERTEKLLFQMGYEKDDYIQTILGDWKWRHHHLTYHNPIKNIKVEVHWRLNPGPGKEPSFNELWKRKRNIRAFSKPLYYLGNEDLLFFLITHGARHGWSRLRWLIDIDRIIEKDFSWDKSIQLLDKYGYVHVGGQAVNLSMELLGTKIPSEFKQIVLAGKSRRLSQEAIYYIEKMVELHSGTVPEDIAKYHKRHLLSLMSNHQKFLFIISCLYPYPTDQETLPLPKNLHFLYFPLRPFLWVWRKTKSHVLT
ncbi:nucleotidyltransferase family protein [Neobacillus drentensis]|uniref:nucleotidyltransferase domain-containing protein n=1 Tax=Neobacillus drentensis TaxID=220684 RepID=UPI002FFF5CDF